MTKERKCCGDNPIVWRCNCNATSYCGCDVEKIECGKCGRVVWGADEDSVCEWNEGKNDEPDLLVSNSY